MAMNCLQWHLGTPDRPIDPTTLNDVAQGLAQSGAQLALVFADVEHFRSADGAPAHSAVGQLQAALQQTAPGLALVGCSTAGEIVGRQVFTGTLSVTGLRLDHSTVQVHSQAVTHMDDSEAVGLALGRAVQGSGAADGPRTTPGHLWVLAPGVAINGSALVQGLMGAFHDQPLPGISGGLAGDGGAFRRTHTVGPAGVSDDQVVVVAFNGPSLIAGSSAQGGWEPFGPVRRVTRAQGNRLYEMDHEPALAIYRRYLGDYARDLPASGLLFPLQVTEGPDAGLIRTILGIDEDQGGLILAGDIPPNAAVRLMNASPHHLVQAAEQAVTRLAPGLSDHDGALALLVSCVGRRIVMGDLTDEEVEAVVDALPSGTGVTGFYSNGEIAAWNFSGDCRLHNQTMTISWLSERGTAAAP